MSYKDVFEENEILNFENEILSGMNKTRDDFNDELWNNFNFLYEALSYFDYGKGFWVVLEFVNEKFYSSMFIVTRKKIF